MARLEADQDVCVGSAHCTFNAPDLFELNDEGQVVIRQSEIPPERLSAAEEAVRGCPSSALRIVT